MSATGLWRRRICSCRTGTGGRVPGSIGCGKTGFSRLVVYGPDLTQTTEGVEPVDLDSVMRESDFVTAGAFLNASRQRVSLASGNRGIGTGNLAPSFHSCPYQRPLGALGNSFGRGVTLHRGTGGVAPGLPAAKRDRLRCPSRSYAGMPSDSATLRFDGRWDTGSGMAVGSPRKSWPKVQPDAGTIRD